MKKREDSKGGFFLENRTVFFFWFADDRLLVQISRRGLSSLHVVHFLLFWCSFMCCAVCVCINGCVCCVYAVPPAHTCVYAVPPAHTCVYAVPPAHTCVFCVQCTYIHNDVSVLCVCVHVL
eukprot:GHVS01010354.1.p1 GENE.GHVS01010354.1~~GHVS01010354.1.p1  ORF type:complete len:121 (+),score=17.59 GHVS01010354.1:1196-1558(+)